jgi:hypothetical protein
MNILRRSVPPVVVVNEEVAAEPAINRRINVTVERETVAILVRGQPPKMRRNRPW